VSYATLPELELPPSGARAMATSSAGTFTQGNGAVTG
jgi:hypothetical protein